MTRVQELLTKLDELFGFPSSSPSDVQIHKATHSLVHNEAKKRAAEHAERFRTSLQDKGLSKSNLNSIVSRAKTDAYSKHYRKAYIGTRRAVAKSMHQVY